MAQSKIRVQLSYIPSSINNMNINATNYNANSSFKGGNLANTDLVKSSNKGAKPFIVGSSVLGTEYTYASDFKGILANCGSGTTLYDISDTSKGYLVNNNTSSTYSIVINGSDIQYLKLVFDKVDNQYATVMRINGTMYFNDSAEYELPSVDADNITIEILAWNKPLMPIRVAQISMQVDIVWDKDNGLMEMTRGNQATANNITPSYQLLSQYGSLVVQDPYEEVVNLIKNKTIVKNITINMYKDDTVVGSYVLNREWAYDIYTKELRLALEDDIIKWQGINIKKTELSYNVTGYDVFLYLKNLSGNYTFYISSEDTEFIKSIKVPYFYLEEASLWQQWNKFCNLCQCQMYQDTIGRIVIKRFQ